MTLGRRGPVGRAQETTPFNTILLRLCDATPALGAALVDLQGETVDFAGAVDPYDIKVAAAEWRLVLDLVSRSQVWSWRDVNEVVVRGTRYSYVVVLLREGYAIVAQLSRHAFGISFRAIAEAKRDLLREAGLPLSESPHQPRWVRVDVRTSDGNPRRPAAIWLRSAWCPVVVLGRYGDDELADSEVAYRVRCDFGNELTLVREPLGVWYADDLTEAFGKP
jgi:hypothetical protein